MNSFFHTGRISSWNVCLKVSNFVRSSLVMVELDLRSTNIFNIGKCVKANTMWFASLHLSHFKKWYYISKKFSVRLKRRFVSRYLKNAKKIYYKIKYGKNSTVCLIYSTYWGRIYSAVLFTWLSTCGLANFFGEDFRHILETFLKCICR